MKLTRHGIGYYGSRGVIGPACWPVCDLIVMLEGSFTFRRPREGLTLAAGDAVIIPPGVEFHALAGKHGGTIWIAHFQEEGEPAFGSPGKEEEPGGVRYFPASVEGPWKQALLRRIHEIHPVEECAREAELLFGLLLEQVCAAPSQPSASVVRRAIEWADERRWRGVTVKELAAQSGYSASHFRARFAAEMGCSVGRYLKTQRLEIARDLLRDAGKPIKEISERLGYGEVSAFHHAFLAANGCTPGEYRRRNPALV